MKVLAGIVVLPVIDPIRVVGEVAVTAVEFVVLNRVAPAALPPPEPQAEPLSTKLPLGSIFTQLPFPKAPVVVANVVVLPLRVPTVGTAPAPPPITGKFAVSAAELARTPDEVYARTPPDVPDAKFVPPLATGKIPVTPVVSGNPVTFVMTPLTGVPSAGATRVLFDSVSVVERATRVSVVEGNVNVPPEVVIALGPPGEYMIDMAIAFVASNRNICREQELAAGLIVPAPVTFVGNTNVCAPDPSWQMLNAISWPVAAAVVLRVELVTLPVRVIRKF